MLKVEKLSYSYPQKDLFSGISFTLDAGRHCALVGTSGSGKSTLLQILLHPQDFLYDGRIEFISASRPGYVSQFSDMAELGESTVFSYIAEDFLRMQKEISEICERLETETDFETLLNDYQNLLDAFDAVDGNNFENNIKTKLNLANIGRLENQKLSTLSGGEFKLVQVIREMLTAPTLIFMDEPDVFLDFDNLNALKTLINSYPGTMLIITHNRYLLNHCFDKVIHIENTQLREFDGRYPEYIFSLLQYKIEQQELSVADQLEIDRNSSVVDKLRASATNLPDPSKGRSLKARVSLLKRLEERKTQAPFVDIKQPAFLFSECETDPESTLLSVIDYHIAFDDILLEHASFEIKSGEKIAIIGANGTGKTTLLKEIYRQMSPSISISPLARISFLSQDQGEILTMTNTVEEELQEMGFADPTALNQKLSDFCFPEEIRTQKVGNLSGGEKNLLQLAKITAAPTNLLLLDEPTSHLDTYSQLSLEKAIRAYHGAVLMVSHDFYSIVNCMDQVYIIEEKSMRRMSMRKFRKMIYTKHFNLDYLLIEQKKGELERQVELALKENDFPQAKKLSDELEKVIQAL